MTATDATRQPPPRRPFPRLRGLRAAAALLVAFGAGGVALHLLDGPRRVALVTLTPGPVASVKDGAAALEGRWPRSTATSSCSPTTPAAPWSRPGRRRGA